MKYLCLVYHEEVQLEALRADAALAAEVLSYHEELRQSGQYIASARLQSVQNATAMRIRHGQVCMADDPLAEMPEQLSGIYLISARDLNDAIRVARRMPSARRGCVEIRPIEEINIG